MYIRLKYIKRETLTDAYKLSKSSKVKTVEITTQYHTHMYFLDNQDRPRKESR